MDQKTIRGFVQYAMKTEQFLIACKGKTNACFLSQVHYSFEDLCAPAHEEEILWAHSSYATQYSGHSHRWLMSI